MRSLFGSVLALWILCGCYKRIAPVITTQSSINVEGSAMEWRASIPTTIRNPTKDIIQLDWNPILQQNTEGVWRAVAVTFSAGREPVRVVNPRDSLLISFVKEETSDMRIIMRRGPLSTGEYRFRFGWWQFKNGKEEKGDTVTSRAFRLVIPELSTDEIPRGYHLGKQVPLPDSLVESRAEGRFQIEIVRVAPDTASRKALTLAESVFPDASEIERAASKETLPLVIARLKKASELSGDRWWWSDFDAVLTPYAITSSAVDYYLARIRARSDSANPFVRGHQHRGKLSYRATVISASDKGAPRGGHIARMSLYWYYSCGALCAMEFSVSREVLISREGRILEVRGDGRPLVMVS